MSEKTDRLILDLIKQHYRPYDTHEEFRRAFSAYLTGHVQNPHRPGSIAAQAWDCGTKAAMHYESNCRLIGVHELERRTGI